VHENNTIWIMEKGGTLSIRPVSILFRDEESVLINQGISAGEQLIVSNLTAPVDGMQIRTEDETPDSQVQKEKRTL
jgi:hypothetical protein